MARVIVTVSPSYTVIPYFQDVITIDKVNDRVGVNNIEPTSSLDVVGDVTISDDLLVNQTGTFYQVLNLIKTISTWERDHLLFYRHDASNNPVKVGGIYTYYQSLLYLNNTANGTMPYQSQHIGIDINGRVGIGLPRPSSGFATYDAKLLVDTYTDSSATSPNIAVHIKSFENDEGKTALLIESRDPSASAYTNTYSAFNVLFQVDDDGSQTINGDVTHTGDTTQTGNISVTGTVTSTGVTNASGLEATSSAESLILKSPDGTRWRVTVDDLGNLTTTAVV